MKQPPKGGVSTRTEYRMLRASRWWSYGPQLPSGFPESKSANALGLGSGQCPSGTFRLLIRSRAVLRTALVLRASVRIAILIFVKIQISKYMTAKALDPIKALIPKTLKGKALREYKQTITLNTMQREILVGTLLGDASMPLQKGQPVLCVKFEQNISKAGYIQHLYSVFYRSPTLLAHLRKYGIFVAVAHRIDNL